MILSSLRDLTTEPQAMLETQGLRPELLSGAPFSGASEALIADNSLAEFPNPSDKPRRVEVQCHPKSDISSRIEH
jgi:hypothetical protein